MFRRLRSDIRCILDRDPAARGTWEVLTCYPGLHALLTREELVFLDAYNKRVRDEIGPMVDGETLAWLEAATAPFSHG